MDEKEVKTYSELTLSDLLTVDVYDKVIDIKKSEGTMPVPLILKDQFFKTDGLYVEPQEKGLRVISWNRKEKNDEYVNLGDLLNSIDNEHRSVVLLIEGYAGCGKSTLVQFILSQKIGDVSFSLYNYNIEEQNNAIVYDEKHERVANSSIFNAIKKCFIRSFYENYDKKVCEYFKDLIDLCRNRPEFDAVYYLINSNEFDDAVDSIERRDRKAADKVLYSLLMKTNDANCIFAIDYFFRIALWKLRKIKHLYICYDNLDAIEDASDLKDFDDKLISFVNRMDYFVQTNGNFFDNILPHFVIMATYRKITTILAELDKESYNEVRIDIPRRRKVDYVKRIDATSAFSYKKIVEKRKSYFVHYFETSRLDQETDKAINKQLKKLKEWDELNSSLEIMQDNYSVLWNRNYRTCSFIADLLFSDPDYDFERYIDFIKKLPSVDGYNAEEYNNGDNILCTYFGKSAILLNSVCRVFKTEGIWDDLLKLTELHPHKINSYKPYYRDVSLSRLVLTYIYNKKVAKLEELYSTFCKQYIFSIDELCDCLSKMVARESAGVWRRPIYYCGEAIISCNANEISVALNNECRRLERGLRLEHRYSFQLCDSGVSYVERMMSEFEFYSSRLRNKNQKVNLPLYMYKSIPELRRIMHDVFCSVRNCCKNMIAFKNEYTRRYRMTLKEYLKLDIHPKTFKGSRQLHTERIVFSHIAYLNQTRLYFIDSNITPSIKRRKQYNALFVEQIKDYLDMYDSLISKISKDRRQVYVLLYGIVKEILGEQEKEIPNEEILFKSISLNRWRQ